jgi:hypothetical protein
MRFRMSLASDTYITTATVASKPEEGELAFTALAILLTLARVETNKTCERLNNYDGADSDTIINESY